MVYVNNNDSENKNRVYGRLRKFLSTLYNKCYIFKHINASFKLEYISK